MLLNCGIGEDSWESLGEQGNQTSKSKGNQPWIFIERTDAEAPIFWPPDAKSQLTGKDSDAGKDWGQEEEGVTEDEMARWHHQLSGCEFGQTLGDSGGQESLACWSPWGCKESDKTKWLNDNNKWNFNITDTFMSWWDLLAPCNKFHKHLLQSSGWSLFLGQSHTPRAFGDKLIIWP